MRRATALLAAAASLAGCPAGPVEPSATPARVPAVDLDTGDCGAIVAGRLFARDGALWFDDRPSGEADGQDEAEPPWDASDAERLATRTWEGGDTLLSSLTGTFSTLVPGPWDGTAIAVRSYTAGWGRNGPGTTDDGAAQAEPAPDALGVIGLVSLSFMPWWSPGGRLHLVGKVGDDALVLAEQDDGPHLVAVTRDGALAARSPTLDLPQDMVRTESAEVGLPWIAPLDANRLVLRCGNAGLCVATVGDTDIAVAPIDTTADELAWSPSRGPLLVRGEDACVTLRGTDPAGWADLPAEACPDDRLTQYETEDPLPVDGLPTSGVRGEVTECLVRSTLTLPPLRDPARRRTAAGADDPSLLDVYPGTGVILLNDQDWTQDRLDLDLLVRGDHVAIGFAFLDGLGAATLRRDFGVALPPGSVEARPTALFGRAMYRVRIRAWIPFPNDRPGDCWLGRLVVRVYGVPESDDDQAYAERYREFGVCE